jgi:hypothetical protein
MGAFFTNYQVQGKSTLEVSKALAELVKSRAYVSPIKGGWVTVYDESSDKQNEKTLTHIASALSKSLNTVVFAFLVHDSDIAVYWLYQNGNLADEFNSAPDYFSEVSEEVKLRTRGNTEKLLPLCIGSTTREQVEEIIHPSDSFPVMAETIFWELAKLLGIDDVRIGLGFKYFEKEGEHIIPDIQEFEPIGKGAERKKAQPEKPKKSAPPTNFDTFSMAVGMLSSRWDKKHEETAKVFAKMFPAGDSQTMLKQVHTGLDRNARDFLKQSTLPNRPTLEELKAARDEGPESFAKLLIKRTPSQLGSVADGAIKSGLETFISALLMHGMDPNTPNQHGQRLSVAENCKKPEIYRLLKSALDKKG